MAIRIRSFSTGVVDVCGVLAEVIIITALVKSMREHNSVMRVGQCRRFEWMDDIFCVVLLKICFVEFIQVMMLLMLFDLLCDEEGVFVLCCLCERSTGQGKRLCEHV